jgi:MYXO-CTERM domain-containing protein
MARSLRSLTPLALLCLGASSLAHAKAPVPFHAAHAAPAHVRAVPVTSPGLRVVSRDARTGAPTLALALGGGAPGPALPRGSARFEEHARAHLARHAGLWGLSGSALASVITARVHDTGRGGVLVTFRQEPGGVPVFHEELKVLLARDGALVALGGGLRPDALATKATFTRSAGQALVDALFDLYGVALSASDVHDAAGPKGAWRWLELASGATGASSGLRLAGPARARKVLFPLPDRLVPAWHVELSTQTAAGPDAQMVGAVISAEDGAVLYRRDLVASDAFTYRVWAEPTGDLRPLDGPIANFTPHPTKAPDGSAPAFVLPELVTVESLNGPGDPWLPPGATDSRGNNVDAFTDHSSPDGFGAGDVRATTTSPGTFDRTYDVALDPLASDEQSRAAVAQLFYMNNWLHDWWYDSGFDEVAGNAQHDNFGRGGEDGDRLRAEAQDGALDGSQNNANMATPEDGLSPRMQMFLWSGASSSAIVAPPLAPDAPTGTASFGPSSFDVTAELALATDGVGTPTDACEPITSDVAGKLALIDRGQCTFEAKVVAAEAAGAVGVVLANNQGGPPPAMPPSSGTPVGIPVLSVTLADGDALEAALQSGPVVVTLQSIQETRRDGTIDNLVVAHEWGHYLHHRLVFCALPQCGGESEGWGDFLALHTAIRPGDALDGAFASALYGAGGLDPDNAYFGLRRYPYSIDPAVSPLTFRHIQDGEPLPQGVPTSPSGAPSSEVHNAGEVWASMLLEGYVRMLQASEGPSPPYSFEEARRRMGDYVVLGMQLAPAEPTFTEQRDALLAAALASDADDALRLAEGFAARGAGSCAVSPPRESFDNVGVVESFEVAPAIALGSVTLDDALVTCDGDGTLDAGEAGTLRVVVQSGSLVGAPGTTLTVEASDPAVTFPEGATVTLADLTPFAEIEVPMRVELAEGYVAGAPVTLTVTLSNPIACEPEVTLARPLRIDVDDVPAASAADGFESLVDVWTPDGDLASDIWRRDFSSGAGSVVWHGVDYGAISDSSLVSPPLVVSSDQPLVLSFSHRHSFEASNGPGGDFVFWDGGVIEVSEGGGPWQDVSSFGAVGYGGTIGNEADNPLSDREGFVAKNAAWPAMEPVTIDLGAALAGKTIQLRFRIGTDQAASDYGWEIDDVALAGLASTPFPAVTPDAATCGENAAPLADAGLDQDVTPGVAVTLDASASLDPDGDTLTFAWSQLSGPAVTLVTSPGAPAAASFVAPAVAAETELTFEVVVSDGTASASDVVAIRVAPAALVEPATGGCACEAAGSGASRAGAWAGLIGLALALGRRRRRAVV